MKMKNRIFINTAAALIILTGVVLFTTVSCSGGKNGPASPNISSPEIPGLDLSSINQGSIHKLLDMAVIRFDPSTGDMEMNPLRTPEVHLNLTAFLNSPQCPNSKCLTWYVKGYDPVTRIWTLDMNLINPTIFNAHDLRVIFMGLPGDPINEPTTAWEVVNPDSYTNIWDTDPVFDNTVEWLNPFIAFNKEDFERRFQGDPDAGGPLMYADTEELQIHIPANAPGGEIVIAVDACWPAHCYEPYQIPTVKQDHAVPELVGAGTAQIEVVVADWDGDVDDVSVYIPDILGEDYPGDALQLTEVPDTGPDRWPPAIDFTNGLDQTELEFINEYGQYVNADASEITVRKWIGDIENVLDVPKGFYDAIVVAHSDDLDGLNHDTLYNRYKVKVDKVGSGGPGGTTGVQIAFAHYDTVGDTVNAELYSHVVEAHATFKLLDGALVAGVGSDELEVTINPAGTKFAFVSNYNKLNNQLGDFELYSANIKYVGGQPSPINFFDPSVKQLTNNQGDERTPDWSQDGALIAYCTNQGTSYDIYTVNPNVIGSQFQVTVNFASDEAPCFDRSQPIGGGSYGIYFQSDRAGGGNYEIYWIDPSTQESSFNKPVRETFDQGFDGYPASSFITGNIAWTTDRFGNAEIMMFDGTEQQRLTENDGTSTDAADLFPSFSPNGEWITFMSDRNNYQFDIWRMTTFGGEVTKVGTDEMPDLDPFFSFIP